MILRLLTLGALVLLSCTSQPHSNEKVPNDSITVTQTPQKAIPKEDTLIKLPQKSNDTIFILKDRARGHTIYIEKNRQAKGYKRLFDFSFDSYDLESLESTMEAMKKQDPRYFKQKKKLDLPEQWLPLYSYKAQYYLYAPCDWGNTARRILNDSTLIYWDMTGPYPVKLLDARKINKHKYHLKTFDPLPEEPRTDLITVHILDSETQLSVWEFKTKQLDGSRYELMIPRSQARKYDLVVNHSSRMKQREYNFEPIDYQKLIKTIPSK